MMSRTTTKLTRSAKTRSPLEDDKRPIDTKINTHGNALEEPPTTTVAATLEKRKDQSSQTGSVIDHPLAALEYIEKMVQKTCYWCGLTPEDNMQMSIATNHLRCFFNVSLRLIASTLSNEPLQTNNEYKQNLMQMYASVTKNTEKTIILEPVNEKHSEEVEKTFKKFM